MNEKNIFVLTERLASETEKLQRGNKEVIESFGKIFSIIENQSKKVQAVFDRAL